VLTSFQRLRKPSKIGLQKNVIPHGLGEMKIAHTRRKVAEHTVGITDIRIEPGTNTEHELVVRKRPVLHTPASGASGHIHHRRRIRRCLHPRPVPAESIRRVENRPLRNRHIGRRINGVIPIRDPQLPPALLAQRSLHAVHQVPVPDYEMPDPVDAVYLRDVKAYEVVPVAGGAWPGGGELCGFRGEALHGF
jgi:hypothetical protein